MTEDTDHDKPITNAQAIIDRFGGIRPMATKMNVPVTTVQGWKERGHIPGNRRDDILEAAFLNDIVVTDIIDKNPDFDTLVKTASRKETPVTREKHEHALEAGRITALQDEVAGKVKAAEARAIQKSTIAAILLILTTVFICGFLGWAEIKAVKTQMKQLAAAEDKIKSL